MTDKPAFTPGPWHRSTQPLGDRAYGIHAEHGGLRHNIVNWGGLARCGSAGGQANAHLISAAPDMYAALNGVLAICPWRDKNDTQHPEITQALAALRKARGEQ
jgi:hypothetical protein